MAQTLSHRRSDLLDPPRRILIIDDDRTMLMALSDMLKLRLRQLEVDTADSGEAALKRLAETRYDLIITDLKMPGMDGITLIREAHSRCPDVPNLMLTGAGDTAHANEAVRAGAYGFLEKPVQRDSFVMVVTQALQRRGESVLTKPSLKECSERLNHCQEAWRKAFLEHRKLFRLRADEFGGHEPAVEMWLVLAERHARLVEDQIALTKQIIDWYRTRLERRQQASRLKSQSQAILRDARHVLHLTKARTA